ncbi:hypothetical protein GBAR_LOCUS758 [Geodia barretti]|uniref:Uncharacterized protein n=1 Tax=Geodia barretti TaxID=519541 RepID=A0AA35VTE4_GEOBA|nr:hypothetical protein GBAR_LOCUS758 [Geodia barretti]
MRYASDIEVIPPSPVECTLRICRSQLVEPLERALGENVVRSEQARLAVGELVTGATDSSSTRVDLLTSLSHPQCALST